MLRSPFKITLVCAAALLVHACGNNYQAPVTEAGQRQVITPPIIVDSSSGDEVLRAQTRAPVVGSTSSASTPTPAVRPLGNPDVHVVRPGETLFSIAFQYDLDFRSLAIANDLDPPYTIFVDQELLLDVSQVSARRSSSRTASLGTPAPDNSVARTQAGGSSRGVIRQAIGSQSEPSWRRPHTGAVVRGFNVNGNEGIDIGGNVGDAVYAASDGDVVYTGRGLQGVGNLIIIRHNDRFLSAYGNNRAILVEQGDHVQGGDRIAEVGLNGSGEAVLHFEIREEGKAVNPGSLLP